MSNFLFITVKTHCCDVGQCYDGAGAMKGRRAGLKTLVQQENPLALYVHCYAHCLQLAVQDLTKSLPLIQSALNITSEIAKLIKSSPKRKSMLNTLTSSIEGPSVRMRTLCPTRLVLHTGTDVKIVAGYCCRPFSLFKWTVRAEAINAILINYSPLLQLWEDLVDQTADQDVRARIAGVGARMNQFETYFGWYNDMFTMDLYLREPLDNYSLFLQAWSWHTLSTNIPTTCPRLFKRQTSQRPVVKNSPEKWSRSLSWNGQSQSLTTFTL